MQTIVCGWECSPCVVDCSVTTAITLTGKLLFPQGGQILPDDAQAQLQYSKGPFSKEVLELGCIISPFYCL